MSYSSSLTDKEWEIIEMLSNNIDYFKSKPVNIPKITILLDNGYHPKKLEEELKKVYPQIMTKINLCFVRLMLKRLANG